MENQYGNITTIFQLEMTRVNDLNIENNMAECDTVSNSEDSNNPL